MALKQLKVNMIFGGAYYVFDTVLEEEEIPPSLRKAKYLKEPEESELSDAEEYYDADEDLVIEDEELPPTHIPSDSRAKYFKPKKK